MSTANPTSCCIICHVPFAVRNIMNSWLTAITPDEITEVEISILDKCFWHSDLKVVEWCKICSVAVCGQCKVEHKVHKGHDIVSYSWLLAHIEERMLAYAQYVVEHENYSDGHDLYAVKANADNAAATRKEDISPKRIMDMVETYAHNLEVVNLKLNALCNAFRHQVLTIRLLENKNNASLFLGFFSRICWVLDFWETVRISTMDALIYRPMLPGVGADGRISVNWQYNGQSVVGQWAAINEKPAEFHKLPYKLTQLSYINNGAIVAKIETDEGVKGFTSWSLDEKGTIHGNPFSIQDEKSKTLLAGSNWTTNEHNEIVMIKQKPNGRASIFWYPSTSSKSYEYAIDIGNTMRVVRLTANENYVALLLEHNAKFELYVFMYGDPVAIFKSPVTSKTNVQFCLIQHYLVHNMNDHISFVGLKANKPSGHKTIRKGYPITLMARLSGHTLLVQFDDGVCWFISAATMTVIKIIKREITGPGVLAMELPDGRIVFYDNKDRRLSVYAVKKHFLYLTNRKIVL
jgi:hypothetical protein